MSYGRGKKMDDPPDTPEPDPPKAQAPSSAPGTDLIQQASENGVVIPIVHGTARCDGVLIERYAPNNFDTTAVTRQKSTAYALGAVRRNRNTIYVVAVAGTTGTGDGPSGTGAGQVDGTVTWDYIKMGWRHLAAIAFAEGQIFGAGKGWQDKNVFAAYTSIPHDSSFLQLNLGTGAGSRPAWWPLTGTGINDVYGNTALLWVQLGTTSDADLPQTALEIQGIGTGVSTVDVNPADIAIDLLTHSRRGAAWISAMVDAVSTGSGNAASWWNYCKAAGFILSWAIDSQQRAKDLLQQLLVATNTDAVWTNRADGTGGMLKFVPLGTDAITANGATFTPNLTPAYAIGPDDLLEPISFISKKPETEVFNSWPIEYVNRAADYKRIIADDIDMADQDLRGLVRANTITLPMVLTPEAATQLSRIKAQRSVNVQRTYTLQVGFRFMLLEPTDLVTVSDPLLGFVNVPMRVTRFQEDRGSRRITLTLEDFPTNVGAAATYTPQANDGYKPTSGTALQLQNVLPGQAKALTVPDATSTRGGSVDNLWPNPTSEVDPSDGSDTTTAEWAGRLNAGAGAYAGDWVRQLTALSGARQLLGDQDGLSGQPANQSSLGYRVTCAPGDVFYIEAQAKWITVTGAEECGVYMYFVDKDGTNLGGASHVGNTGGTGAGWVKTTAVGTAPAGTVAVRFFCFMNSSLGNATAQFDAIYARRAIGGPILGDGTAWFAKAWAAFGNVDLGGGAPVLNHAVNIASIGAGAAYNGQGSIRLTWVTPPAAFAPSGSVYPLVVCQGAYGGNLNGERLVPVGLIGSPPTAIDLQRFASNTSSTVPLAINGLNVFHVHIFFEGSTAGFAL